MVSIFKPCLEAPPGKLEVLTVLVPVQSDVPKSTGAALPALRRVGGVVQLEKVGHIEAIEALRIGGMFGTEHKFQQDAERCERYH